MTRTIKVLDVSTGQFVTLTLDDGGAVQSATPLGPHDDLLGQKLNFADPHSLGMRRVYQIATPDGEVTAFTGSFVADDTDHDGYAFPEYYVEVDGTTIVSIESMTSRKARGINPPGQVPADVFEAVLAAQGWKAGESVIVPVAA